MHDDIPMDFMSNEEFCAERPRILQEIIALKNSRRVFLGHDMSLIFESPRLIWWQIQEILRVEQGDQEQLHEEWAVYRSLMPSAHFLTATMMIEINDPVIRKKTLRKRIGIERQLFLEGAGFSTRSEPVDTNSPDENGLGNAVIAHNTNRGTGDDSSKVANDLVHDWVPAMPAKTRIMEMSGSGKIRAKPEEEKTSSVHFLRFPLNHTVRKALALGEPVLSCHNRDALYRAPISRDLWTSLCNDVGIIPVQY
jgi:hypothetical protein